MRTSDRKDAEDRLKAQLDVIKSHIGTELYYPGNLTKNKGGKNGWTEIIAQEKFVTDYLKEPAVFFPKGTLTTPQEIPFR